MDNLYFPNVIESLRLRCGLPQASADEDLIFWGASQELSQAFVERHGLWRSRHSRCLMGRWRYRRNPHGRRQTPLEFA